MSLFNEEAVTAVKEANASKKRTSAVFTFFVESYKAEFNAFWRNQQGFTPQEMATAWGTDGALLFSNSSQTLSYINSIDSTALDGFDLNVPYDVTINQDGTVTVTDQ